MKKTATLLMKELNYIREEIERINKTDLEQSCVPLNENMEYMYVSSYSYSNNRTKIKELQAREMTIKSALARFNSTTKVEGLNMTIAECLVRIGQIKSEIKILGHMARVAEYDCGDINDRYSQRNKNILKTVYDQEQVRKDLRELQHELTEIQIAVDRTNLSTEVEC